jgi:hypothetical protein
MQFLALFVCFEFCLPHHSYLTPYIFAVPDFDSLSIKILDPVNAVFFNSFRDRCIRFNAPEVISPYVAYNLLPRLKGGFILCSRRCFEVARTGEDGTGQNVAILS